MKKISVLVVLALVVIIGFRLYQKFYQKAPPSLSQIQKQKGIPVDVLVVKKREISKEVIATGKIGSDEETYISSKVPGRVISVNVEEGMFIKKDQPLVIIDDSQLKIQKAQIQNQILMAQTSIESIKIQMDDAERDYKRMEELFKENVISKKQLELYQVKFETLKKNYESAQKNLQVVKDNLGLIEIQLNDCIVKAPFDGIIGNKMVDIGEIVGAGQVLMTVYNTKKLNAKLMVPEVYLPQLNKGQSVEIQIDAIGDKKIYGKISKISGAPDPKTRMFDVYCSLPYTIQSVKPGMFVNAKIMVEKKADVFVVPAQAVFEEGGKKYVYIVENDTAKKIEVLSGEITGETIEILSGLLEGQQLVTFGKENITSGDKVQVINKVNQ